MDPIYLFIACHGPYFTTFQQSESKSTFRRTCPPGGIDHDPWQSMRSLSVHPFLKQALNSSISVSPYIFVTVARFFWRSTLYFNIFQNWSLFLSSKSVAVVSKNIDKICNSTEGTFISERIKDSKLHWSTGLLSQYWLIRYKFFDCPLYLNHRSHVLTVHALLISRTRRLLSASGVIHFKSLPSYLKRYLVSLTTVPPFLW